MMTMRALIFCNKKGQAMTEFVLVLPPLLIMFFAVLYFGKAVVYKEKVEMVARYVSFVEARGQTATGLYEKFFEGAGPDNVSFYTSDDWAPQASGLGWAASIALKGDAVLAGYVTTRSSPLGSPLGQRQPAQVANVSYSYDPPGMLNWIGSKTTAASLGTDADPWKISSVETNALKPLYMVQYQWDMALGDHREDAWWHGDEDLW